MQNCEFKFIHCVARNGITAKKSPFTHLQTTVDIHNIDIILCSTYIYNTYRYNIYIYILASPCINSRWKQWFWWEIVNETEPCSTEFSVDFKPEKVDCYSIQYYRLWCCHNECNLHEKYIPQPQSLNKLMFVSTLQIYIQCAVLCGQWKCP